MRQDKPSIARGGGEEVDNKQRAVQKRGQGEEDECRECETAARGDAADCDGPDPWWLGNGRSRRTREGENGEKEDERGDEVQVGQRGSHGRAAVEGVGSRDTMAEVPRIITRAWEDDRRYRTDEM
jgi:hypothetical protein